MIDQGSISYDGRLTELVRSLRPEKRIEIHLERAIDGADLSGLGARVVERQQRRLLLQAPQSELRRVVAAALSGLPVLDLTVEDAPLEEVLADLFASSARRRAEAVGEGGGRVEEG